VEFAIWTAKAIASLDAKRVAHPFHRLHPGNRLLILLALVNHEIWQFQRHAREQVADPRTGSRSTVDAFQTLRTGLKLRSHEAIESAIEGFSYVVSDALRELKATDDVDTVWADIDDLNDLDVVEYINFGTSYRVLFERWQRVLFLGSTIERQFTKWRITTDVDRGKRAAVGEMRKYRQVDAEATRATLRYERAKRPIREVSGVRLPRLITFDFALGEETWTFESRRADAEPTDVDRLLAAHVEVAMYTWIAEMAGTAFDSSGTTCKNLLETWLVLRELAESFMAQSINGAGVAPLEPFLVGREFLCSHVALALECSCEEAGTRLTCLTHDGRPLTELYGHPLIRMDPELLAIFVPGLVHADFERVVVQWLLRHLDERASTITLEKPYALKGHIFEAFIRRMLQEGAARAALPGWAVEPDAIRFDQNAARAGREFDLLVTFGKTLIVGEVKCSAHPSDPTELAVRENLIETAVRQVRDQVEWIRQNWMEFRERLSIPLAADLASYRILPVVLLDGCYGPGFAVDGVSVIDGQELRAFMLSGQWQTGNGKTDSFGTVDLYHGAEEAEAALPAYLEQPPIVSKYLMDCRMRDLAYSGDDNPREKIVCRDYVVRPNRDIATTKKQIAMIAADFKVRVSRARSEVGTG
jgi:hypothetical protein